jgi:heat-inducible transcriptional repressor
MLTQRQQLLLQHVVEGHVSLGQPVGSKWLAERSDIVWSSSTVRHELATLEELGYLGHPHTSAGRVPTEAGYRLYANTLLAQHSPEHDGAFASELSTMRREVDTAMRRTTEMLSQVTNLVAAVSAPPLHTATVRHIEVLRLQPSVVLVVVITSTGGVSKRAFTFEDEVDPGLVDWAASYLTERLAGTDLGALMLRSRLEDPGLSLAEQEFLQTLAPAFSGLAETSDETVYVDGATRLLEGGRFSDSAEVNDLMRLLERRVALLAVLRSALDEPSLVLRIGHENDEPELQSASIVASSYGLAHRSLGTVGVIGPLRMDYGRAINSVREAAHALGRFVEEFYE